MFDKSISEHIYLNDQASDSGDEYLLEVGFSFVHLISDYVCLFDQTIPFFVKLIFVIAFILIHDINKVGF
jgi:hypothetical protein